MPAQHRLTRIDFTRMRGFKRLNGRFFTLSFGTLSERTSSGVACVVSSKIAAKAVDRNRIKRRCRAILSGHVSQLRPSIVLVFVAKKGASTASFEETTNDLMELISQVKRAIA